MFLPWFPWRIPDDLVAIDIWYLSLIFPAFVMLRIPLRLVESATNLLRVNEVGPHGLKTLKSDIPHTQYRIHMIDFSSWKNIE
jgi:hypothetical protein